MTEFWVDSELRPTYGASISPDATAFAHIVDDGGYPRAVQRFLRGVNASSSRPVELPVEGPIDKVIHSPDGGWLACQTAPSGGIRSQVWVVTTDPEDRDARRIDDAEGTAELIGWDGRLVAINSIDADGLSTSQVVDPQTGLITVVDRRPGARLMDSWAGSTVVRVGARGQRSLILLRGSTEVPLFPPDPGSTTDAGVILDDHKKQRLIHVAGEERTRLYRPSKAYGFNSTRGFVRMLVRSDWAGLASLGPDDPRPAHDFARLVQVTVTEHGVTHRVLAEREDADLDEFAVSDNLSTVALLWNRGGASELQILELSDATLLDPVPLPWNDGGRDGVGVASELSISADGSLLALTVQSPGRPRSVQVVDPRTGEWEPIEPTIRQQDPVLPTLEHFAARDGLALSGWLYRAPVPTGAAVIYLHGGPEGQARPDFSELFPAILDAGITVFAPNVRGSGGLGRAFSHADDGALRFAGIDDVADCVGWLVEANGIDPTRIGCAGWSYGGYLTLAALTFHPELFASGVSICGMSDLASFYRNTEPWIAAAALPKYGHPVRDRELLAQLSPMNRLDSLRAPLLVVHGGNDTNVPVSESRQIVAALRARGAPVDLLIFDDEGHTITKQENREQLAARVRDWLASPDPATTRILADYPPEGSPSRQKVADGQADSRTSSR